MEKKLLLLFVFLTCIMNQPTLAQGSWAVGVHFGESYTSLTGDADSEYRLGFSVGGHASHYLLENLVLRLEVNYDRKGAENAFPANPFTPEPSGNIRLDYLSLPVMVRYSTTGKPKFIAGGGVAVSYLLNEKAEYENVEPIIGDDFNTLDADILATVGLGYPIGKQLTLSFELRSNFGLVDVGRIEGTTTKIGRNVSWGIFAGINYYLK